MAQGKEPACDVQLSSFCSGRRLTDRLHHNLAYGGNGSWYFRFAKNLMTVGTVTY